MNTSQIESYTIRRYRPDDSDAIIDLMATKSSHPDDYRSKKRKIWDWQYHQNPHNTDRLPYIYVIEIDGQVAASLSMVETKIRVNNHRSLLLFGMDFIVSENIRRTGLGGLLITYVQKTYRCPLAGFNLSPSSTNLLINKLNWEAPTKVNELFFLARNRKYTLKEALKATYSRTRFLVKSTSKTNLEFDKVRSLPKDYDDLWEHTVGEFKSAVDRDRDYIDWKYLRHPIFSYDLLAARTNGELSGVIIFRTSEINSEKTGIIAEIIAPPSNYEVIQSLIQEATRRMIQQKSNLIRCVTSHETIISILKDCGYFPTNQPPIFVLWHPYGTLRDPDYYHDQWFLSGGDSDHDISAAY